MPVGRIMLSDGQAEVMILTTCDIESGEIRARLGAMLQHAACNYETIQISTDDQVYGAGDSDTGIYWVETGCVKLMRRSSPKGGLLRLVGICGPGDLFGESCLNGQTIRSESAVAMEDSRILKVQREFFLSLLGGDELLISIAQHLAGRIADCNQTIASLSAENEERELILDLLHLAVRSGTRDVRGLKMDRRHCREDLAVMTGATLACVDMFLKKLERLGFLTRIGEGFIAIDEWKVQAYLTQTACRKEMSTIRIQ